MTPKSGETLVEGPSIWVCSLIGAGTLRQEPMSSDNLNWSSAPTEMRAEKWRNQKPNGSSGDRARRTTKCILKSGQTASEGPSRWGSSHIGCLMVGLVLLSSENQNFTPTEMHGEN